MKLLILSITTYSSWNKFWVEATFWIQIQPKQYKWVKRKTYILQNAKACKSLYYTKITRLINKDYARIIKMKLNSHYLCTYVPSNLCTNSNKHNYPGVRQRQVMHARGAREQKNLILALLISVIRQTSSRRLWHSEPPAPGQLVTLLRHSDWSTGFSV